MRYFVVDFKSQKYGIPKKIRETIYCTVLLHNVTYHTSNCFLAWMSVFVWYAIKIDIRPCPVSIFGDYGAIKENIYGMLRKQAGKWQHQTSRQSLHSWEFCIRLWRCFSDGLKIVSFQMQQFSFPIHSQVTFNTDKRVKELQMERFGMITPQDFAKQFQNWEFPNIPS